MGELVDLDAARRRRARRLAPPEKVSSSPTVSIKVVVRANIEERLDIAISVAAASE